MPLSTPKKRKTVIPGLAAKSSYDVTAYHPNDDDPDYGSIEIAGLNPNIVKNKKVNFIVEMWAKRLEDASSVRSRISYYSEPYTPGSFLTVIFAQAVLTSITGGIGSVLSNYIGTYVGSTIGNLVGSTANDYVGSFATDSLNEILASGIDPTEVNVFKEYMDDHCISFNGINAQQPLIGTELNDNPGSGIRRSVIGVDEINNKIYATDLSNIIQNGNNIFDKIVSAGNTDFNQIQIFEQKFTTEFSQVDFYIYHYNVTYYPDIN